jgi:MoaA/NifB/PqqE/SkfB family radical SAM enzyme
MSDLVLDHWHVEVSSICTLKCPRCTRAEVPETLLNKQLDLNFFKTQITESRIRDIRMMNFCGNDGDPIYCKEFLEICSWIKSINPIINIRIVTNGSYKTAEWWQSLASILNEHDEITWSLDGWDHESNNKYRKNSDWESIIVGINSFFKNNNSTYRVWGMIPFSFNQDMMEYQKQMAKDLGFDQYRITKSSKFGYYNIKWSNDGFDELQPRMDLVSPSYKYEVTAEDLTSKIRPNDYSVVWKRTLKLKTFELRAKSCLTGEVGVFINSLGEFYPCCWSGNRYSVNNYWLDLAKTKFNLKLKTLDEILLDPFWKTDFLKFDSRICKIKCSRKVEPYQKKD